MFNCGGKMRKKSLEVKVEPEIIKWVIKSSGWALEDISKKLNISNNTVKDWIEGKKQPTLKQLENLSKYLKRPLAVFFLSNPPEEKPLPKDYRMLSDKSGIFDKKTILAIRVARRLQKVSKELAENLQQENKPDVSFVKISDSPKKVAESYRNNFQITEEIQKKWNTSYEAFNALRDLIEKRNIIVFQFPMLIEDARGFALVDDVPPIIVVNSKDQIEARIFSLMHEFGHVLLKESGVDMPESAFFINRKEDVEQEDVERWCDEFAAAFLLPELIAKKVFTQNKELLTETKTLNNLSKMYKVSKRMLLYNMLKLNYIPDTQYKAVLERYRPIKKELKAKQKKKGGPAPAVRCLNEKGKKFISLVSANLNNKFITISDALDYLSIKSRHYDKMVSKMG